jgi:hypothetical protein
VVLIERMPRGSDGLKLTAINGHQLACYQTGHAAKLDEGTARRNKGEFVVFAKVGDGLEVWLEPIDQPHDLDVALTLGFKSARRANPLEIAVEIKLQLVGGIIRGATGAFG